MNILAGFVLLVVLFIAFPLLVYMGGLSPDDTMPSGEDEETKE